MFSLPQLKPYNNDKCLTGFMVSEGESPWRWSTVMAVGTIESSSLIHKQSQGMLTDNDGNLLKPGRSPSLPSDTPPLKRPHLLILSKYFHQLGTNILIYEGCSHSNHHTLSSETSVDTLRASLHMSSSSSPPLSGSASVYLQCAGSMACRNPMWVNFHSPWWQAAYSWDKMLHSELSNLIPSLLCL